MPRRDDNDFSSSLRLSDVGSESGGGNIPTNDPSATDFTTDFEG
jgi:hypothetical protein